MHYNYYTEPKAVSSNFTTIKCFNTTDLSITTHPTATATVGRGLLWRYSWRRWRGSREVADKIMTDEWYMEMVEKDQDDCTTRLICEVSHKKASGTRLNSIEEGVMDIFGKGKSVDTSKSTTNFDFAA